MTRIGKCQIEIGRVKLVELTVAEAGKGFPVVFGNFD